MMWRVQGEIAMSCYIAVRCVPVVPPTVRLWIVNFTILVNLSSLSSALISLYFFHLVFIFTSWKFNIYSFPVLIAQMGTQKNYICNGLHYPSIVYLRVRQATHKSTRNKNKLFIFFSSFMAFLLRLGHFFINLKSFKFLN